MSKLVFDLEGNHFLDEVTKVHCMVLTDVTTGEEFRYADEDVNYPNCVEALPRLTDAEKISGHNIIRYDIPVLQKIYGWDIGDRDRYVDTLVMARTRFAHIKEQDFPASKADKFPSHLIGRHSLEAWGYRLGENKIDYLAWCEEQGIEEPFRDYRPEMMTYCAQDVGTNVTLMKYLFKMGLPVAALKAEMDLAWYLAQQERNGWPVHEENYMGLVADLSQKKADLETVLVEHFGSWDVPRKDDVDENGVHRPFIPKVNNSRWGYVKGEPIMRYTTLTFNPNSRHHIEDRLRTLYGWKPEVFTPSGQAKLDEDIIASLDFPIAEEMQEYLKVSKFLGMISEGKEAWAKHMTPDGLYGGQMTGMVHIHHSVGNVAVTHRHRHSKPNLGQVPTRDEEYGPLCRSCFTVPKGFKLLGSDASGLELRCLANRMAIYDNGSYGDIILNGLKEDGTDIHSQNAKAVGCSRDDAKTVIYALLYGSGDQNLGSILLPTASAAEQTAEGKRIRAALIGRFPALKLLIEKVQNDASNLGWLRLPDGRRTYIRTVYAALNSQLQGDGSIVCIWWINEFNRRLCKRFGTPPGGGWDHEWAALGWIHDEVQLAVREEHAEEVAEILKDSMLAVTDHLSWRLPLEAEADIGMTWDQTH